MELLRERQGDTSPLIETAAPAEAELAARRALRRQIAKLECDLTDVFLAAAPTGGLAPTPVDPAARGRMLGLGELETIRDDLAERVRAARAEVSERAESQAVARGLLERMLLEPGHHRFTRVSQASLGEPGCGVWQVRPRLGLIGMLAGWWHVKLSSGCPLPEGHGARP